MTRLRFEAYLGSAVDQMASALVDGLRNQGLEVDFDARASDPERRERVVSGSADVVWACGLLTLELMHAGAWDAEIVAAPVFTGQSSPVYHSVLIAAAGWEDDPTDLTSARIAVNQMDSWSGLRALELHIDPTGARRVRAAIVTGSHVASIEAVAACVADVAAIDHVVWSRWSGQHPDSGLVVFGRTRDWPAPPISVSRGVDTDTIRRALMAVGDVDDVHRSGLARLESITVSEYEVMRRFVSGSPGGVSVE